MMKRNILIVCEGTSTEPNYFNYLHDKLIEEEASVTIKISPRPANIDEGNDYEQRPGSKRRTLFLTKGEEGERSAVEEKFKAQPMAYVREAQKGLEDGTYDEVWAVYDKDGHPKHPEAYKLANENIQGKFVNLGFSSIAFEYWILLHFEDNNTAFERSMCRITKPKQYFYCGTKKYDGDCEGENCVCGRIVTKGYLSYESKRKDFDVNKYHLYVYDAIKRAVKIEMTYADTEKFYTLNPITTIYKLVYKLLHWSTTIFSWFQLRKPQFFENLIITFLKNKSEFKVDIRIKTIKTEIIPDDFICLFNVEGNKKTINKRRVLGMDEQSMSLEIMINLEGLDEFAPIFVGYRLNDKEYSISPF